MDKALNSEERKKDDRKYEELTLEVTSPHVQEKVEIRYQDILISSIEILNSIEEIKRQKELEEQKKRKIKGPIPSFPKLKKGFEGKVQKAIQDTLELYPWLHHYMTELNRDYSGISCGHGDRDTFIDSVSNKLVNEVRKIVFECFDQFKIKPTEQEVKEKAFQQWNMNGRRTLDPYSPFGLYQAERDLIVEKIKDVLSRDP